MVKRTVFPTANPISQTDAEVQGNLLREYEQKFAERPEQQKLTKLCSNADSDKGQFFIAPEEEGPDTSLRSEETSHVRGWIRGNTKIGPSPGCEGLVCFHQKRYGTEILIESLFRDGNSFLGSYCERNQQIRNRNVRRNSFCKC